MNLTELFLQLYKFGASFQVLIGFKMLDDYTFVITVTYKEYAENFMFSYDELLGIKIDAVKNQILKMAENVKKAAADAGDYEPPKKPALLSESFCTQSMEEIMQDVDTKVAASIHRLNKLKNQKDTVIVGFDFTQGNIPVLVIGRKEKSVVEIVNTLKDHEAIDLYLQLVGKEEN